MPQTKFSKLVFLFTFAPEIAIVLEHSMQWICRFALGGVTDNPRKERDGMGVKVYDVSEGVMPFPIASIRDDATDYKA